MNAGGVIVALDLPSGARVDQRVPKKLLLEHAPTAADKRRITEGIDEVQWVAALKPATVGVPPFRDEAREYLEIAVLSAALRPAAKTARVAELIHRGVPYPVVLIIEQGEGVSVSLAHKRWSQSEMGATVLDGDLVSADIASGDSGALSQAFLLALSLPRQPRAHLFTLYQGWLDAVVSLLAARLTGAFVVPETRARAAARHEALRESARLDTEIARLRAAAAQERQVPRQVELNLELKRVERLRSATVERL